MIEVPGWERPAGRRLRESGDLAPLRDASARQPDLEWDAVEPEGWRASAQPEGRRCGPETFTLLASIDPIRIDRQHHVPRATRPDLPVAEPERARETLPDLARRECKQERTQGYPDPATRTSMTQGPHRQAEFGGVPVGPGTVDKEPAIVDRGSRGGPCDGQPGFVTPGRSRSRSGSRTGASDTIRRLIVSSKGYAVSTSTRTGTPLKTCSTTQGTPRRRRQSSIVRGHPHRAHELRPALVQVRGTASEVRFEAEDRAVVAGLGPVALGDRA